MSRTRPHTLIVTCAALLIAVFSVVSASLMAPERGDGEIAASALILGVSVEDICGDEGDHDHGCPFCRLLADPPDMQPVSIALDLRPQDGFRRLADVARGPLPGNPNHAPRAPPARA